MKSYYSFLQICFFSVLLFSFGLTFGQIYTPSGVIQGTSNHNRYVGIGTNSPTAQLHVNAGGTDCERLGLVVEKFYTDCGVWPPMKCCGIGEAPFMIVKQTSANFASQNKTHFFINSYGRVGVGTENTPYTIGGENISAYRLFVKGGILADEVRVRTGWADYVFGQDYKLMPLSQVEEFITENNHLPNIPSAEKVESQGVELGDVAVFQQEKIEEIFLHLIDMEKRVKDLEEENKALKAQIKTSQK